MDAVGPLVVDYINTVLCAFFSSIHSVSDSAHHYDMNSGKNLDGKSVHSLIQWPITTTIATNNANTTTTDADAVTTTIAIIVKAMPLIAPHSDMKTA